MALVVVGTDARWETEGKDRSTLQLPGDQDALVSVVAAVSPRTIVVVNSGAPVEMPWADEVDGIVQVWYPGQEGGTAIADVLFGDVDASGRLPTTFPVRLEDTPSFPFYPGDGQTLDYGEGLMVGYRYYDPSTDQFLSVDPDVAETGQPYAFTEDDPLNVTDPLGLRGWYCIGGATHYYSGNKFGVHGNGKCGSTSARRSPIVEYSGSPLVLADTPTDTITVQAHLTVHGPDPYDHVTFSSGGVEADFGRINLSSSDGLAVVDGPCAVRVGVAEFSCTVSSQTYTVGSDSIQGSIEATEQLKPPQLPEVDKEVAGAGAEGVGVGVGTALWWGLKPVCAPLGPAGLALC